MNLFTISFSYLHSRLQNSILNVVMMSAGIMLITILLLFFHQMEKRLTADAKGIDLVIGAKGSPLQLVLSTILHIDIPTGNINLATAKKIKSHPQIKKAIPISLGDSYHGFRIVGSNKYFLEHFQAEFTSGKKWQNRMQAVIGHEVAKKTNLKIGDKFASSHGLVQGGHSHDDDLYEVVGILKPTKTVLDRLIATSIHSIWNVHLDQKNEDKTQNKHHKHEYDHDHDHKPKKNQDHEEIENREITAILVSYKNRMAAFTLPRYINKNTNMQAASPAFEINRLIKLVGFGKDSVILFSGFLIILSLISILIGLLNAVESRRYDLAIFRTLGASRKTIFLIVIIEGMFMALLAALIGLAAGCTMMELIGICSQKGADLGLNGFIFVPEILVIILAILLFCFFICLIPAIRAYKTDIKKTLIHVS